MLPRSPAHGPGQHFTPHVSVETMEKPEVVIPLNVLEKFLLSYREKDGSVQENDAGVKYRCETCNAELDEAAKEKHDCKALVAMRSWCGDCSPRSFFSTRRRTSFTLLPEGPQLRRYPFRERQGNVGKSRRYATKERPSSEERF